MPRPSALSPRATIVFELSTFTPNGWFLTLQELRTPTILQEQITLNSQFAVQVVRRRAVLGAACMYAIRSKISDSIDRHPELRDRLRAGHLASLTTHPLGEVAAQAASPATVSERRQDYAV